MSYAIINNKKYKLERLSNMYKHNERKQTYYTNKNIDMEKTNLNYHFKVPEGTYREEYFRIREKYNLKGQVQSTSNVLNEVVVTSDKEYFKYIGEEETKRYFKTAYDFMCNFNGLKEQYIVSAIVHMDETTPHMHLTYLPVVHVIDEDSGEEYDKVSSSDFWKDKFSYKKLQDEFYDYIKSHGFELERGIPNRGRHYEMTELKRMAKCSVQDFERQAQEEKVIDTDDVELLKSENKRLIRKINTLVYHYINIQTCVNQIENKNNEIQRESKVILEDNKKLEKLLNNIEENTDDIFEFVSILFNFPKDRLERLYGDYKDKVRE